MEKLQDISEISECSKIFLLLMQDDGCVRCVQKGEISNVELMFMCSYGLHQIFTGEKKHDR
jgi:hypothetical protein